MLRNFLMRMEKVIEDIKCKAYDYRTNQLMDHLEDAGEHPEEWEW